MFNKIDTFIFVKITRENPALCMISIHKSHLLEQNESKRVLPRIQDKLHLPLSKDPKTWDFHDRAHRVIRHFLHHQTGIICFLAIDGFSLEFPVLSAQFFRIQPTNKVIRKLRSHYQSLRKLGSSMCADLTSLIGNNFSDDCPKQFCNMVLRCIVKHLLDPSSIPLDSLSFRSLKAIHPLTNELRPPHKRRLQPALVFLDMEFTGNPKPKIMEICMSVILKQEFLESNPKPLASILLVIDPEDEVNPYVKRMTGLSNTAIKSSGKCSFSEQTALLIEYFLKHCAFSSQSKGVVVAHGGMNSDFPVLMNYLKDAFPIRVSSELLCADTLHGIRSLDYEYGYERGSCKLQKLHKSLHPNESNITCHDAEADVNMLIDIINSYPGPIVDWLFENGKPFLESDHRQVHGDFMRYMSTINTF